MIYCTSLPPQGLREKEGAMNEIVKAKVRKYVRKLKRQKSTYSKLEAINVVTRQVQMEEGCNNEEAEEIREYTISVVEDNWPFKSLI